MAYAEPAAVASVRLLDLHRCLQSRAGFGAAAAALPQGDPASFDGVWGSACALLAAALAEEAPGPLLIVAPLSVDLDELCDDLSLFSSHAGEVFPAWETSPQEHLARDEVYGERLRMLKR